MIAVAMPRPTTATIAWTRPKRRTWRPKSLVGIGELAGLLGQHDRHAVADRIGEAGGAADQLSGGPVILQRRAGDRTDQHLEQARIDLARRGRRGVSGGGAGNEGGGGLGHGRTPEDEIL